MLLCVLLVTSPMVANENLYFPKGTKWMNRETERDPMTGKITSNSEGTYIISEDTLIGGKTYHKLIDEKGPDHNKRFIMQVGMNETVLGIGEGKSKKEAEQLAAKTAINSMN